MARRSSGTVPDRGGTSLGVAPPVPPRGGRSLVPLLLAVAPDGLLGSVLLPLFFAESGLRTDLRALVHQPVLWLWCGLICALLRRLDAGRS